MRIFAFINKSKENKGWISLKMNWDKTRENYPIKQT